MNKEQQRNLMKALEFNQMFEELKNRERQYQTYPPGPLPKSLIRQLEIESWEGVEKLWKETER